MMEIRLLEAGKVIVGAKTTIRNRPRGQVLLALSAASETDSADQSQLIGVLLLMCRCWIDLAVVCCSTHLNHVGQIKRHSLLLGSVIQLAGREGEPSELGAIIRLVDNLAEQGGIGRVEAKLNGIVGVAKMHSAIGEAQALVGRHQEPYGFAVIDRLTGQWKALGVGATVGGFYGLVVCCKGLGEQGDGMMRRRPMPA
jgi:hypothetical protein